MRLDVVAQRLAARRRPRRASSPRRPLPRRPARRAPAGRRGAAAAPRPGAARPGRGTARWSPAARWPGRPTAWDRTPRAPASRCGRADRRRRAPAPPWSGWSRGRRCRLDRSGSTAVHVTGRVIARPASARWPARSGIAAFSIGGVTSPATSATAPCAQPGSDRSSSQAHMRPYHVAIVGSGPSGFFAAASLLKAADASEPTIDVARRHAGDAADAVGSGALRRRARSPEDQVDQQAVREDALTTRASASSATSSSASTCRPAELAERYDAVVYAVGAQSDRPLDIPGEDLPGSVAAVDFVGWYNAHPHFEEMSPDLSRRRAVVVGNGNVALDVARILVTDPDVLALTDIADHALESLHAARRRGGGGHRPPRAAADHVHHAGVARAGDLEAMASRRDRRPGRLRRASPTRIAAAAGKTVQAEHQGAARLRRARSRRPGQPSHRVPVPDLADRDQGRRAGSSRSCSAATNWSATTAGGWSPRTPARARSCRLSWWCASVGYRGVPTPGLPFDDKSAAPFPHTDGRVDGQPQRVRRRLDQARAVRGDRHQQEGLPGHRRHPVADLAGAGRWPNSATTMPTSWSTGWPSRQPKLVTDDSLGAHRRARAAAGEPHGRPRVKLPSVAELLRIGHG